MAHVGKPDPPCVRSHHAGLKIKVQKPDREVVLKKQEIPDWHNACAHHGDKYHIPGHYACV